MKRLLSWQVSVRCRRYKIDQGWKCTTPWNGGLNYTQKVILHYHNKFTCTVPCRINLARNVQWNTNYWIVSKSQRCLDLRKNFKYSWNYHFGLKKKQNKTQECKEAVGCFVPELYGDSKHDVSFRVFLILTSSFASSAK